MSYSRHICRIQNPVGLDRRIGFPAKVVNSAQAFAVVRGDGSESSFMPVHLDDLASVHGQGSSEAKANASARDANDDPDLVHERNLG